MGTLLQVEYFRELADELKENGLPSINDVKADEVKNFFNIWKFFDHPVENVEFLRLDLDSASLDLSARLEMISEILVDGMRPCSTSGSWCTSNDNVFQKILSERICIWRCYTEFAPTKKWSDLRHHQMRGCLKGCIPVGWNRHHPGTLVVLVSK